MSLLHRPKMAGRGRDLIAADVHKLITQLSGFSETEDPENFELCEKFAFSNLLHHRFLSVDSHAVRRSVLGMVTKFMIHGHIEASRRLDSLLKRYLKLNIFKDKEVQWGILSLLVKLADNPTSHIDDDKFSSSKEENEEDTSKPFNWTTYSHFCDYLKEGNENFDTNFNASSDSEWEDMASDPDKREHPIISEVVETSLVAEADFESHPVERIETVQTQLVEHHRKCAGAEEWLSENVQDPWWTSTQLTERVNSLMPSANFSKLWDSYCDSTTSTVSEYKVLREILWMLQAPTTTALFQELDGQFIVQPNMSIPSLTMSTTLGYLNTLCEYFTMIHHLQKFQKEIYPMDANFSAEMNVKQAPHTFEAYTVSVVDFLRTIQGLACEIEKKIKKQDDIYTLYSLNLELGPKLSQLRAIFNAHVNATKGWKESENWLSSARLLSVLYEEALSCMECDSPCVLLKMFLKSFRPYVDLIDLWLTEGRLEDYRNEFVITKKTDTVENEEWGSDFTMRPFIDNLKSSSVTPLPLLQVIAEKVLHAGRNMQLLQRLDRLGDMRSQNSNCGRMYGEFLVALEKEVAFSMKDKEKMDVSLPVAEPPTTSDGDKTSCSDRFITNVTNQLEELKDSFLMHAFRDYIPFKSVTHKKEPEMLNTIEEVFRRLALYSTCGLIPLKPVMERILSQLIDAKHSTACLLVKSIFLQEFNLSTHIGLIRAIYLMEAGDIMHRFCYFIFKEAEHGLLWANSYTLTAKLEECINLRYPEHSSKFSISVNDNAKLNGTVSVMDEINIEYHVDWPLTVILSAKNMEYYNSVFQFLLKVKWALWTLEGLRFSDLENATQGLDPNLKIRARCLHLLRFWLLHSVGSVHTYLMGQVLHSLGLQLEQDLNNSMDLDSLVRSHNNYVNLVHNHCLQPRSSDVIKAAILQMVQLSLELHEIWSQGVGLVQESKLLNMTDLYIKCHCFLGSVLQTAVELGHASHLSAPVPFSSSSALNKCSVFADHMQYSLAFLSWQQDPPLGISTPLPSYLLKYLEIDAWNDKRTDTLLNTQKLETFLDNYFVYLSGMKRICNSRSCIHSIGGSCHTIQRSSRSMSNALGQNSTYPLGLYMDSLVSTLRSETCVPRFPPVFARPLRKQDFRGRSETECSFSPPPQTPDSENEVEVFVDNDITKDDSFDSQKIDDTDEHDQDYELPKETENEDTVNQTSMRNLVLHKHDKNSKSHLADVPEEISSHIVMPTNDNHQQKDLLVLNMRVSETRVAKPSRTDLPIVTNPSFPSVLHIEENFIAVEKKSAMMGVTAEISTSLISCSYEKVSQIQNSFIPVARNTTQMSTLQVPEICPCDGCRNVPNHSITPENSEIDEDSSASTVTSAKDTKHHEKSLLLNQRTLKNIRQKCVKPNIKHASKSGRRFYDCGSNILPKSNLILKGKKRILSSILPLGTEFSVHSKRRSSESSAESLDLDDVSNPPSGGTKDKIMNQVSGVPLNYAWLRGQMSKEEQREITRQKLLQLHKSWDEKIGRLSKHLMKTVLLDTTKNTHVLDDMMTRESVKANEIPHRSNKSETESPEPSVSDRIWDKVNREFKENMPIPTGTDVEQRKKKEHNGNSKANHKSHCSDQCSRNARSR